MKRFTPILILFIAGLFSSCDDGDIIITTFEFDDATLQLCEGNQEDEFVLFKINTTVNEAISFRFFNDMFNETTITSEPIAVTIDGLDNQIIYRQFNTSITADYFCSTIPPGDIIVTNELIGTEGTAEILVQIIEEDDNDGIPAEEEDLNNNGDLEDDDSDGDGIPNYKDQDDDNDNILTSAELPNDIANDDTPRNTDGDELPDYLDPDDDNDTILTKDEDTDSNGNPRDDDDNDNGTPNYLDNTDTTETINESSKPNSVETTYRTTLDLTGLKFENTDDNFDSETFSFGFKDTTIQIQN